MILDFIVIGAQKSGTTLLTELLRRSPEIAMPGHEVRYFRDPFYPDKENPDIYFGESDQPKLKGIKHPAYLGNPEVPDRIKAHSPQVKLIAILRDPPDRTLASYLHYVRMGQIPCIHPDIGIPKLFADPQASPKYTDIIAFGNYSHYLKLYLEQFSREQILILHLESFITSRNEVSSLFDFLSIDSPDNIWPLPSINSGIYDWTECCHLHQLSRLSFLYDEMNNIVGRKPDINEKRLPTEERSEPVRLSYEAREIISRFYAISQQELAELGY
ncbi:MAG: sulfotransferase domain-containing protein [Pseudolabrys sp.]|nr:sulfotransferase domain-containing protein [Pseudolabrys sp.]